MKLSIVMPTIDGREKDLANSIAAYCWRTIPGVNIEWLIEHGHPTCAAAWNAGAARATGEVLHMAADDIEPETDAWLPAALEVLEQGNVPVGWIREKTGTFGRDFCRVPICMRDWWLDVPEIHYWSDNAFTDLMVATGHEPVVAEGFDFFHHSSNAGLPEARQSRMARESATYRAWQA